jgi:hypothetical protein
MRISLLIVPLLLAFAVPLHSEEARMPIMTAVDPIAGVSGDVLTVQGQNLGGDDVAAVFLTDGKHDYKAAIVEQADTSIKLKIPAEARPGRFSLMVLTKGKHSTLIEEPVKVTVELPASRPTS